MASHKIEVVEDDVGPADGRQGTLLRFFRDLNDNHQGCLSPETHGDEAHMHSLFCKECGADVRPLWHDARAELVLVCVKCRLEFIAIPVSGIKGTVPIKPRRAS